MTAIAKANLSHIRLRFRCGHGLKLKDVASIASRRMMRDTAITLNLERTHVKGAVVLITLHSIIPLNEVLIQERSDAPENNTRTRINSVCAVGLDSVTFLMER